MKIYHITSYSGNCITNHGYFDFVECQAKVLDLTLEDNVDKIEIYFKTVKTYSKEIEE